MTDLTMTYTTDLRAAVEQRRAERRRQQADAVHRARQLAFGKAPNSAPTGSPPCADDSSTVRILALFGLRPEDATIHPTNITSTCPGRRSSKTARCCPCSSSQSMGATYHYANVRCSCPAADYEHEYRGLMPSEMADRIMDAAEEALKRLTAEQESA